MLLDGEILYCVPLGSNCVVMNVAGCWKEILT